MSTTTRVLIAYPFPLDGGQIGKLSLPTDGLREGEAARLRAYIDSLVVEPVRAEEDDW